MVVDHFHNGLDPIEVDVLARSPVFIEELLHGRLDAAMARRIAGEAG